MIAKNITGKLFATTSREWQLCQCGYLCTDTSGKEGLSGTSRPGLIPTMRLNHPKKTQRLIPQDPLWGILFLRLEGTHLSAQDGVFYRGHNALLRAKAKLFSATRDLKALLEVFKRLPVPDYLLGDPVLRQDGGNIGSVLSPHDVSP